MKRFYCTICQRVKRVRVIPTSVKFHGDDVRMREGTCSWHSTARHVITPSNQFNTNQSIMEYAAMRPRVQSQSKKSKKAGK